MAMWSMTTLVAPVMGPLLGGWITDNISWPWIFYINIPVGFGAAVITWTHLPQARQRRRARCRSTRIGLGAAGAVGRLAAADARQGQGARLVPFGRDRRRWRVVAVVGFAFFLIWELTDKHPVVDLSLFKRRNFWSGAFATAVAYGLFFGNVVLLPLWLQQFMGYTATAGRHDHGAGGPAGDRASRRSSG